MRRINNLYLILILIFISSCSDELFDQSDRIASADINGVSQLSSSQRAEMAKSQLQTDEFTRWDTPWWDMSDEEMADSIRATDGEVIISFKEPGRTAGVNDKGKILVSDQTKNSGINTIKKAGAKILRESKLHPSVLVRIPIDTNLISTLRNHPFVDIFEPNITGRYASEITWNIDRVDAPDYWSQSTGSGARLLIIDSGIDENHNDLNPANVHGCDGTNGVDQIGHGTSVAGVAAAIKNGQDVVGVAHNVELWSASVGTPVPNNANVLCAVEYGRINNVDVMNMSVDISSSSALTDEINAAYNQDNIIMVGAAGNTNGGSVVYPANLSSVIAVTATDNNNNTASFAAIGPEIELAAPGVNVEATDLGGGTTTVDGTSFASPHVAGAAALLRAYNPSLANTVIRNRLNTCARSIPGTPNEVGNGLLDLAHDSFVSNVTHSVVQSPIDPSKESPKLDWDALSGATEYEIQRKHWQHDWKLWASPTSTSYTDIMTLSQNLQATTWQPSSYWVAYRVRAITDCGPGPWSQAKYFKYDSGDSIPTSFEEGEELLADI